MEKMKSLASMLVLAFMVSLTGCSTNAQTTDEANPSTQSDSAAGAQVTPLTAQISEEDTDSSWDAANATNINLNGTTISVQGTGAAANGGVLTITEAGTYVVSGTLSDGQIAVNATKDDLVRIVLNGADITNRTGAPLYASQCDKLVVILAEGSANTLTDGGENFVYANSADEEPNAALFCKDDLSINGAGTLTVNAGFNNGIGSKDDLVMVSGNFIVNAANHGLRGNDSLTIIDGSYQVTAGNDAMQTNNTEDADKGWLLIEGGSFELVAAHDAIQADTTLSLTGGDFEITTGGGAQNTTTVNTSDTTSDSFKGLKTTGDLSISGGSYTIDSYDDCVHANGNVTITGGSFTLSTADDAIHADGDVTVNGGDINVTKSYEGIEGYNVTITNGNIQVTSSNDGINAVGEGGAEMGGGPMRQTASPSASNCAIKISGGSITVKGGEDGFDSNGDIVISGGNVISLINTGNNGMGGMGGTGGMDCDGTLTVTGGTVIYGGTSTGVNPGGSSTQSYVYLNTSLAAGSKISLQKNGQTLVSFTPEIACQTLVISTPDVVSGESYDLYNGTNLITTVTAGTGGGTLGGGPGGQGGVRGDAGGDGGRMPRGN